MSRKSRKKKTSTPQTEKAKETQLRKGFINKVVRILKAANCPHLLEQLSNSHKQSMFALRFTPLKVVSGHYDINAIDIKIFSSGVKEMLAEIKYTFVNKEYPISAYDMLTVGITLYGYLKGLADKNPDEYQHLFEQINPITKFLEQEKKLFDDEITCIISICMFNGNLAQQLYYTKRLSTSGSNCSKLELNKYVPTRRHVRIDGISRIVYQVGWMVDKNFNASVIQSEKIKADISFPNKEYKVYAQAHALNRLSERLNEDVPGFLHIELFNSIIAAKSFMYYRNSIYIDYYYGRHKAGYLVGKIIDGIIVLKTFLFLTHSSTPEGEKLKELTGLNKLDIKYLNIDKLKSFQESDIKEHEEVKKIFVKAGCGSLFEIPNFKHVKTNMKLADTIMEYLFDSRKDYSSIEELEADMQEVAS